MDSPRSATGLGRGHPSNRAIGRMAALGAVVLLLAAACGSETRIVTASSAPGIAASPEVPQAMDPPTRVPTSTPSASTPFASTTPPVATFSASRSSLRLAEARSRATAFAFGSQILLAGGLTANGTTGSILVLSPRSGRAIAAGALVAAVHDAGGTTLGDAAYIFGGGRSGPGAAVQRVDRMGHAVVVGRLPTIRADLASVTVGSRMFVVGGGTPSRPDDRILATIDGRVFRVAGHLRIAVRYPAVVAVGPRIYVIGGATPRGDATAIQVVDADSGGVAVVGHLPRGMSHASAFVLGDAVLLAGGRSGGQAQDGLWRLDEARRTFDRIGRLPMAVSDMASVTLDGTEYLIGGEGTGLLASVITITAR
jgi:hypothetical protein